MYESLFTSQSYAIFRPIANILAFISPTCSDKYFHRRQISVLYPKCVANIINFVVQIYFHKPCENYFIEISAQNICRFQEFFISLQLTQLVRKGERVKTC